MRPADVTGPSLEGWSEIAGMTVDPSRRHLYLFTSGAVESFSIDPTTGALKQGGSFSEGLVQEAVGGQSLLFTPSGKFAFFVAQSTDGSAVITRCSFDEDPDGVTPHETTLTPVERGSGVAMDADGKYLYIAGTSSGTTAGTATEFAAFSIDPDTGKLSSLFGPALLSQARVSISSLARGTNGKFVYATGNSISSGSPALSTFVSNSATGALEEIPSSPVNLDIIGGSAASIVVSPSGKFAYVTTISKSDDDVSTEVSVQAFSLNSRTGVPLPIGVVVAGKLSADSRIVTIPVVLFAPNQTNATNAQLKSTGASTFLYLANPADGTISVFSADSISGLLTLRPTSTGSAGH